MHGRKIAGGAALLFAAMVSGCAADGPEDRLGTAAASDVPAANFSENDDRWACDPLGSCSGATIGKCADAQPTGAALSAVADVLVSRGVMTDPKALNAWLSDNHGYQVGCFIKWDVVASYGGLHYLGQGRLTTPADLKAKLDAGVSLIARSTRVGEHWVAFTGYVNDGTSWHDFGYADPWDASSRNVGDGWVEAGAPTRGFQ